MAFDRNKILKKAEKLIASGKIEAGIAQYRQLVQEHIAALSQKCSENRIDYALFDTATPIASTTATP